MGAHSVPAPVYNAPAAAPPIQVLIQNNSSVSTTQKVINAEPPSVPVLPPKRYWESAKGALTEFVSSPLNRVCMLGILGLVFTIYQGSVQHNRRMAEMQRRIDNSMYLRF